MIKFFRQIRQQMIKENKVTKYALYAIGEILLVVIGILIALQINNWNQKKSDIKKEKYLVNEMLQEFKNDSIELQAFIRLTNVKVKYGKIVKGYLQGITTNKDTIFPHLFYNGKTLLFDSFSPTYDEIVSSGQLNIIRNDSLKVLIKDFKEYVEGLDDFLFYDLKEIKQRYNFHLYKYFDHEIMTKLWEFGRLENKPSSLEHTMGLKKDFEGFNSDPESYYFVTATIGADAELNRSYSQIVMAKLERVIQTLRQQAQND